MALPAVETGLAKKSGDGDVHAVDARAVVYIIFARPAEDYPVIVPLTVKVHMHHGVVVKFLDRIVHVVQADHFGMAELLVDALLCAGNTELLFELSPENYGAGDGR